MQDCLESALQKFAQREIKTTCAGRTDAGVHALEQVIHLDTDIEREPFSWVRGTNAFLPPSIAVRWAMPVAGPSAEPIAADNIAYNTASTVTGFHARFSAIARTYHYVLYNHPVRSALLAGKVGWVFRPLDVRAMEAGAQHLIGTHDFSAFRAAECQAKSPVKSMHDIRIRRNGHYIVVSLRANAFLHHMVRNIVGSLIYVGTGVQQPEWIAALLQMKDRSQAAPTFMPDGLYLAKIEYDPIWGLPQEDIGFPGLF